MRRFLLIILAGMLYVAGISICCADNIPNYLYPDNSHLQAVNQELDKVELSRNNQTALSASTIVPKTDEIQFSSETYWAKFDEPKNFSQKGFMSGYNAQYAHRISTDPKSIINMFSLQGQWADGKFKQAANVGPSGIKDRTFDFRGVVGKDFYPTSSVRATGYLGYGYRYLKDNSQGLDAVVDGFTLLGYKRYSHYNYLPLGMDMVYQPDPNYSWESNLEYDYMFSGSEVDKIGVVPGFSTLVVDQGSGYGLRASLRLNLYLKYCTAFAEGFYRYWKIAQSNSKTIDTISLDEPRNNTQEVGFRLGLQI
jgi:hypothetical protein